MSKTPKRTDPMDPETRSELLPLVEKRLPKIANT